MSRPTIRRSDRPSKPWGKGGGLARCPAEPALHPAKAGLTPSPTGTYPTSIGLVNNPGSDAPPRRSLSEIRLSLRQSESVERLGRLRSWLEGLQATSGGSVLPKSPMAQAITYALNQWEALCVYTTDGDLAIDNNAAENALRPIAVGRNNWLFAGSDTGGRTAAVLLSLIATCRRHDVEPWGYLHDVLTRVAAHPTSRLRELLPQHHQPQP